MTSTGARAPSGPAGAGDCRVEGAPDAPPAPDAHCYSGAPTEDIAAGLRLYQQERYDEAAELLEREVASPATEGPVWWRRARHYLARAYRHLGRDADADALFRQSARDTDDPFAWVSAGWLCGVRRALPPAFRDCGDATFRAPPAPIPPFLCRTPAPDEITEIPSRTDVSRALADARARVARCGTQSMRIFSRITFGSSGAPISIELSPRPAPEVAQCVVAAIESLCVPPFREASVTVTYPLELR